MSFRRGIVAVAVGLPLLGCLGQLPSRESVTPVAPAGAGLPLPLRVMVHIPQADLDRKFKLEWNAFRSTKETDVVEGRAIEKGARTVLRRAFGEVQTNAPQMQPQLVAKVTGTTRYVRVDGTFKLGCGVDLYLTDGVPVGQYTGRFDPDVPVDYENDLDLTYMLCFKAATEQALASPALQRLVKAGVPAPNPAAYAEFMRSMGYAVGR